MSRQSVDSGKMSVPSVATDRNGQTFMSRQARGITMIEYMSRQAGDHPRSGRRDNSFMPRRPYAGVAPAQPGITPVASTSTSGCTICVWSRLRRFNTVRIMISSIVKIVVTIWPKDQTFRFYCRSVQYCLRAHPPALCPETR
jgi:hypothetical protein